jgi:hypothetical protein
MRRDPKAAGVRFKETRRASASVRDVAACTLICNRDRGASSMEMVALTARAVVGHILFGASV